MNQGLVWFGLFCGEAAQLSEETRSALSSELTIQPAGPV